MKPSEESFTASKPRRPWLRWLKRLGCGLLILLILAVCVWGWWHHSIQQRLDEALAELDRTDPGWRLEDIEAAREQIPEKENSARVVVAAYKLLPYGWPPREFGDLLDHLNPPEKPPLEASNRLTKELANVGPALTEARKLASMPHGRHRISYQRYVSRTLLDDQTHILAIVKLLALDALQRNLAKDTKGAMSSCQAALNAARSVGGEPLQISQVIRGARVIDVCRTIERTLALGEPPPEELKTLQTLLGEEDAFPDLFVAARGERAAQHATLDALESGDVSILELNEERPDWRERFFERWVHREQLRIEHPIILKVTSHWVAIAQAPPEEQAAAKRQFDKEILALPRSAIWTGLLLPSLSQFEDLSERKHACLRCLIIALAAERYRREKQTWPDTIDKLSPQFLPTAPLDPFDGKPLRYRRVKDGVVIYSIGKDAVDNGGTIDREHANQPDADIGFRLWDVAKRRQPPRPKPPKPPAPMPPWMPGPVPNPE